MKRLKVGGVIFCITAILQITARNLPGFAQWYVTVIYPFLVATVSRLFGLFPFSVTEMILYMFIGYCFWYGLHHLKKPKKVITDTILALSAIAFIYTINCGINYYGTPFSYQAGFQISGASEDELLKLCRFLTAKVNESANDLNYEPQWNNEGMKAMQKLGEQYPVLGGFYPRPKGLLVSPILSVQHLSGIYSPFTIEANYNSEMTDYNIPLTICHELSHLKGFMREDEANFIGYLACIGSDHQAFQYSGYLIGWIYATNQLSRSNYNEYYRLYEQLDQAVKDDLMENSLFWERYEGAVSETATRVNDTYLKLNQQSDGVRSYGRFVDLMLAYYR